MDKDTIGKRAFALAARGAAALQQLRQSERLRFAARQAMRFSLCALLSRGQVLGCLAPFGVALEGAFCAESGGFAAVLGTVFGSLVLRGGADGIAYAGAAIMTFACAHVFADHRARRSRYFMPVVASACTAVCTALYLPQSGLAGMGLMALGAALCFGATYFDMRALEPPKSRSALRHPGGMLVLTATLLIALYDITLFGLLSPARVIAVTLVMGAAYVGGSGMGAAGGVAIGITMDAAGGQGILFSCTYSFAALIGGALRASGRIVFAFCYLLAGFAAALLGASDPLFLPSVLEGAVAAVLFLAVPDLIWQSGRDALLPPPQETAETVGRARSLAKQYASETAQIFYEMYLAMMNGASFGRVAAQTDTGAVFDRAAERVCAHCALRGSCWEKDVMKTRSMLSDVTIPMLRRGYAEAGDFSHSFSARCLHFPELIRAINEALFALQQRRQYDQRTEENRSLVAQQYAGLTEILRRIGLSLGTENISLPARERQVRRYASAFGAIDRVVVYRDGRGRMCIEIMGAGTDAILRQGQGFAAGLAALLSTGLTPPRRLFDEFGSRVILRERATYRAVVGMAQRKKQGEEISGDTARYFVTDSGIACLMLSDGMGSGAQAAQDSRQVLDFVERFVRADIPAAEALRTIAPAFRLRCDSARFVTLDVLTIDLFTGQAESLKCGAAPSYLKSGGGLTCFSTHSLPVGLEETGERESVPLKMYHGDRFVLLSDGVVDADNEQRLRTLISARSGDSPKELAARLVTAGAACGAADDMTALVLRLEKYEEDATAQPSGNETSAGETLPRRSKHAG